MNETNPTLIFVTLVTKNDVNGNSRRLVLVREPVGRFTRIVRAFAGHNANQEAREAYPTGVDTGDYQVTPAEYRAHKKMAGLGA